MKPETTINALLDQAIAIGLKEVERRARQLMKGRPGIRFTMAMGGASFYDKRGEPLNDNLQYLQPFYKLLHEFDRYLKLTGCPMKIERHDGPVVTDW